MLLLGTFHWMWLAGGQLQGAVEDEDRKKEEDVEDGEEGGDLGDGALCVRVLLQVGRVGVVEVAAPVGEDDGQGAGDEGDHPQPRLGVAAVQQAQQGDEQKESKEDVDVPGIQSLTTYGLKLFVKPCTFGESKGHLVLI